MRLIDANALKSEFEWLKSVVSESSKDEIQETIQRIENAPTVDAVEVVRCKDCEHWHEGTGWCNKHSHFVDRVGDFCYPEESADWKEFDADYFCKDGEKR